jgi:RimJ/RimL family protein N-acetyltransferase
MLKGDKVVLKPMRREYLEKYAEFLNDVELLLLSAEEPPMPMELERLERQFEAHLAQPRSQQIWFAIEVQGGRFVGQCLLHRFDSAARTCELGITIGDRDYLNSGYGRDAVKLLTRYAFRLLNIEKVWLTTNGSNIRAQRSFAASGFEEEARLRRHIWLNDGYDDLVYMACFREGSRPVDEPPEDEPIQEPTSDAQDAA